jgi:tetratricopeptide (TPR) repeat protein
MKKALQLIAVYFLLVGCVVSCRTMNVETLCNLALTKYEKQDYQGAIDDVTKAIQIDADCVAAYTLRAELKRKRGDYHGAMTDYNQAIKVLLTTEGKEALAALYINRGDMKTGVGDCDGAIDDFTKSLQAHPDFAAFALANRGGAKLRNGDYSGAIADSNKAIELGGGLHNKQQVLALAYYSRGAARGMKANLDGSVGDLDKAIKLYQDLDDGARLGLSYRERGFSKIRKGDYKGAVADYDKAIALLAEIDHAGELSVAYAQRGLAKHKNNDYWGAVDDYNKAVKLNPECAEAYLNRGLLKMNHLNYDESFADYNRAIKLLEGSDKKQDILADAYGMRAVLRFKIGDNEGEIADCGKMIAICKSIGDKGKLPLGYINRAGAKARNKDLDGAVADYTEAIRSDPGNTKALLGRGFIRVMQGLLDDALPDLQKASKIDPNLLEAWMLMAISYSKKREKQNCLEALKKALELNPEWRNDIAKESEEFDWLHADPEFKKLIDK